MTPTGSWVLAVDFGTTNTVAAVCDAGGVRTVTIDGRAVLPSAVLLMEGGSGQGDTWLVGDVAINMARRRMEWFERTPKSWVADGSVFLGGHSVPVVEAVAAVLRIVVDEAAQQCGPLPPASFLVTHPANWPEAHVEVVKDAARKASGHRDGWPEPAALPEPLAAAHGTLGLDTIAPESRIVVLDLGGGTVDAAIVDRHGRELTLVGRPIGMDGAGGEDFDLRLAQWMTEEAGAPGLYRKLAESADPAERERAIDIRANARAVKEELSRRTVVPARLPKSPPDLAEDTPVQVAREQLEDLIEGGPGKPPGLTEAVALVTEVQQGAPDGPPFAGVYLVGGASRIPRLGVLIQAQTGRAPIIGGDPSTAVAHGAAARSWAEHVAESPGPADGTRDVGAPADGNRPDGAGTLRLPGLPAIPARTVLGAVVVVALLAGGVLVIGLLRPDPGPVSPSSASAQPQPTASPAGDRLLATCPTPAEGDCSSSIVAASRAAWPGLPTAGCSVRGPRYGVDRYSVECQTSDLTYSVFWRDSGSLTALLTGEMVLPTVRDFVLPNTATKEGSQAWGTRPTASGVRYTCAWEYSDHPLTMVIDGPNDNATLSLCATATFLDSRAVASALEPW